jgi:hypothetical protein
MLALFNLRTWKTFHVAASLLLALLFSMIPSTRSTSNLAFAADAAAADAPAAADTSEPGLALTIQALDDAGKPVGEPDTRTVRMIGLHVPAGGAASSFAKPEPVPATSLTHDP